jgi:peroxiredoxin
MLGMAPDVGDQAPDFSLPDHSGSTWRLSAFQGRPVVLIFYRQLA